MNKLSKSAAETYRNLLTWCKSDPLDTVKYLYNDHLRNKNYKKADIYREIWRHLEEQDEQTDTLEEVNYYLPSDADMGL